MPQERQKWELKTHNHRIGNGDDYDGCYEITNGKVSIFTKDETDDELQTIVDALNNSECDFYLDDANDFLAHHFEQENKDLRTQLISLQEQVREYRERLTGMRSILAESSKGSGLSPQASDINARAINQLLNKYPKTL